MRKFFTFYFSFILFLLIAVFAAGCSAKETMDSKMITGEIQVVGNEPFTRLALRNKDGIFILDCPADLKDTALKNQGRTANVYFSGISTSEESLKVLKVEKLEVLQK